MDDRINTIAGWVLGAGIVALGASIVTAEMFHAERPETMGYPIEGVVEEGKGKAEPEVPVAALLAAADPAKGEQVFKKCAACHTIDQGGANGIGPNLWGSVGKPVASSGGFAYSDKLRAKGGAWDWETLNQWVHAPARLVPGTKMTFAGLSKAEDRANLIAYMNKQGSNLPLPAAPAVSPAAAAAEASDAPAAPGKAANEPVLNEAQVARQPQGNAGGEGVPKVAGTAKQEGK